LFDVLFKHPSGYEPLENAILTALEAVPGPADSLAVGRVAAFTDDRSKRR
jgi:hypothetical protein